MSDTCSSAVNAFGLRQRRVFSDQGAEKGSPGPLKQKSETRHHGNRWIWRGPSGFRGTEAKRGSTWEKGLCFTLHTVYRREFYTPYSIIVDLSRCARKERVAGLGDGDGGRGPYRRPQRHGHWSSAGSACRYYSRHGGTVAAVLDFRLGKLGCPSALKCVLRSFLFLKSVFGRSGH